MKSKLFFGLATLAAAAATWTVAKSTSPTLTGDYVEVRSCDVYTGSCFANAEMNLAGKEGILAWSIRDGEWHGVSLAGLKVIAVVRSEETLGNQRYEPHEGRAVIIVDAKASVKQKAALASFAKSMAGPLAAEVVQVQESPVEFNMNGCAKEGCASVKAGQLVEISTRCFNGKDHVCGNEETYYPPLTPVQNAMPAFGVLTAFRGDGLGLTWEGVNQRNAFLATFTR